MLQLDVSLFNKNLVDNKDFFLSAEMPPLEITGEKLAFLAPVTVELKVNGSTSSIAVTGQISGRLSRLCGRCLEPFELSFAAPFNEVYARSAPEGGGEEIRFQGDLIDLEPEVLKTIILALPMKAVCREDCRGLCSFCGGNLNYTQCQCVGETVDPRLSALRNFFKE